MGAGYECAGRWRYCVSVSDPREDLVRATARYGKTEREHDLSREAVVDAVVAALRAGMPPAEVVNLSPFGPTYVRTLAREHGIPPAPGGLKSGGKRSRAARDR
jgi:hypothetical protein